MHRADPPPTPLIGRSDIAALADRAVVDLARVLAEQAFGPLAGPEDPGSPGNTEDPDAESGSSAPAAQEFTGSLARLHALAQLHHAVERCAEQEAQAAAHAGAGYPQLGSAWGISRQGARRRWPGLAFTARHATASPLRPRSGAPT